MDTFFSIVIPCYEMKGYGVSFLDFNLNILYKQTFKDFEVIISDQSKNDDILRLTNSWSDKLSIKYFNASNLISGFSTNTNNAIENSNGDWIKIICQDDFLLDEFSLEKLYNHIQLNESYYWISMACFHSNDGFNLYRPFQPMWNNNIIFGNNTLSSPSTICFKNIKNILFDENLEWLVDCEWYQRMYDLYGPPLFINEYIVVNRTWGDRVSDNLSEETKNRELIYIKELLDKKNK